MKKNRFSKFVEQRSERTKKDLAAYGGKSFLSRITKSLNESGYKLSRSLIISIFIIYLLIFFFVGYSLIAPVFFNIPKDISIEDIVSDAKYSDIKENLLKAGISSSQIGNIFYKELRNNTNISKSFEGNSVLQNATSISNAIKETVSITIERVLGIEKSSLATFEIDVAPIYEEIQKDETITDKEGAFLSAVRSDFLDYLSIPPTDFRLVELSKISVQKTLFRLAFGFILAFQGLLVFFAFIIKPLEEMSLSRLKGQIQPWLQMLTNSIQAGNSLSQALEFSQERIKTAPLSDILKEITARYVTYKNLEQALEPLNKWTDKIPELKNVISALVIQEKMGGNLIPVLYSISNLFAKRTLVMQKIESLASEATGQLKIIFIMFFFIILIAEIFMKSFKSPISPVYMFFSKGGGFGGFLNLSFIHLLILTLSFALYKGGEIIVRNEMKF